MRKPMPETAGNARTPASPWDALRAHLLAERERVRAAIAAYPAPIPACDAQFNYLLEQRDGLAAEVSRLDAACAAAPEDAAAVEAFVAGSPFLAGQTAERIRGLVRSGA